MLKDRLAERGYLQGPLLEAFDRVDRARFLPATLRAFAGLDLPLPVSEVPGGRPSFSPRASVLLLLALDVQRGHRVLIEAADGGYLAALATELAGPRGEVVLATGSGSYAAMASRRLRAHGYTAERVRAVAEPPFKANAYDRILLAEEAPFVPTPARHALADLGVLVHRIPRGERIEVIRTVRSGGDYAEILLGDLAPVHRPLGPGVDESWPIRRILALEEAERRVWTGRPGTAEEAEFDRAITETWSPRGARGDIALARRLFHGGYVYLMAGDLESAEEAFKASLAAAPTAEAFTFLGWAWSFMGRFEDAIESCQHALRLDPQFGNAYNDIGAYLIELGRPDEAVHWLERAMRAPRYEARAYPYANLARARLMSGDRDGAKDALLSALRMDPEYGPAKEMLRRLEGGIEDEEEGAGASG